MHNLKYTGDELDIKLDAIPANGDWSTIVDQIYDPSSAMAQSGIAINNKLTELLETINNIIDGKISIGMTAITDEDIILMFADDSN